MRSDSLDSMGDVTSLGNPPYIPAAVTTASDVSDMMGHSHAQQQQQQQMLNHQTSNGIGNNNNGGNVMGLSMGSMQQSHHHQQQQQTMNTNTINIKPDYGLTAL